MEQLKLSNGNSYELVTGGIFAVSDEKIQITILPGDKTFSEIDADFNNEANTEKLTVISDSGEALSIHRDFTYLQSITKQNDYTIRVEKVGTGEYDEEGNEIMNMQNVTGTVYVILLAKPDLRAQVKNLQETVDVLVLEGLGV